MMINTNIFKMISISIGVGWLQTNKWFRFNIDVLVVQQGHLRFESAFFLVSSCTVRLESYHRGWVTK